MHLFHSCPVATPQFSSLSLLMNSNSKNDNFKTGGIYYMHGETLLVASPLSTTPQRTALANLSELHEYLGSRSHDLHERTYTTNDKNNPQKSTKSSNQTVNGLSSTTSVKSTSSSMSDSFLNTHNGQHISSNSSCHNVQVYRSRHGIGLHYIMVKDADFVNQCCSLLLSSYKTTKHDIQQAYPRTRKSSSRLSHRRALLAETLNSTSPSSVHSPNNVTAAVLCVAFSGMSHIHSSSSLLNTISGNLHESITNLRLIRKKCTNLNDMKQQTRLLLSALLFEEGDQYSNSQAGISIEGATTPVYSKQLTSTLLQSSVGASIAEIEKMQILAISERDMDLKADRNINRAKNMNYDEEASQLELSIPLPDLIGFDYKIDLAKETEGDLMQIRGSLTNVFKSSEQFKQPISLAGPPSFIKSYNNNARRKSGLNALQRRKTKNQVDSNKPIELSQKIPIESKTQTRETVGLPPVIPNTAPESPLRNTTHFFSSTRDESDWTANFEAMNLNETSPATTAQNNSITKPFSSDLDEGNTYDHEILINKDNEQYSVGEIKPTKQEKEDSSTSTVDTATPSEGSVGTAPLLSLNMNLNEDLMCSYDHGKLSTLVIEGLIQIQMKSDAPTSRLFMLAIKDPRCHLRGLKIASQFVKHISDEIQTNELETGLEHRLLVDFPDYTDKYVPILRYNCASELRPVPIRVQTRTRADGKLCRVALQISSNPANEDELSDLTILMPVPQSVRGETLVTSPSGGIWNAEKRSVLWRVAELGDGEKFQLQAQFETFSEEECNSLGFDTSPLSFPVLVRCQCVHRQLSEINVKAYETSMEFLAEIPMKFSRRFRLSHRENP